jgi:hypothetical protein
MTADRLAFLLNLVAIVFMLIGLFGFLDILSRGRSSEAIARFLDHLADRLRR